MDIVDWHKAGGALQTFRRQYFTIKWTSPLHGSYTLGAMKDLSRTQREVLGVLELCGRTHAYEIKVRLREVLRHSSVYAALARAEAKGYVTAEWEDISERPLGNGPPRKYYAMTETGREALELARRYGDDDEYELAPAIGSEAELA